LAKKESQNASKNGFYGRFSIFISQKLLVNHVKKDSRTISKHSTNLITIDHSTKAGSVNAVDDEATTLVAVLVATAATRQFCCVAEAYHK
jgi:hypothetical protein